MTSALLSLLRRIDTPTVCNAIEMAQGRRGFDGFTRGTPFCSDPTAGAVVGRARTAKIAGAAPPTEEPAAIRARRMDYYRYMAKAPAPGLAVIADLDGDAAVSAYWGGSTRPCTRASDSRVR